MVCRRVVDSARVVQVPEVEMQSQTSVVVMLADLPWFAHAYNAPNV